MSSSGIYDDLVERIRWLVKLRWLAVFGVVLVIFVSSKFFKLSLPAKNLFLITTGIFFYNVVFRFLLGLLKDGSSIQQFALANRMANVQIFLDLAALTLLIHFSGGAENPFISYFIFHMIIASILLSRRASFLQATLAVAMFYTVVALEYFRVLPHYSLEGFLFYEQYRSPVYVLGVCFVFASTIFIAVYMATSISARLRQREASLEEANALLKEKDRLKSEYVLRVSHDIKEHLAAIQGCLEPVLMGITGELNLKQADLVKRANQRTSKLLFFVRALLEITRIKLTKELKFEYFSLRRVMRDAISSVELKAKDKKVEVNSKMDIQDGEDKIRGAKEYIQETIINLLANAIKYTPAGGKVDILVREKEASALVQIKDTGIGIPKEELHKVFDEFYRASNARAMERDGSGLGLSIAKQIIERHNGKIWLESKENVGTTVYIELPR